MATPSPRMTGRMAAITSQEDFLRVPMVSAQRRAMMERIVLIGYCSPVTVHHHRASQFSWPHGVHRPGQESGPPGPPLRRLGLWSRRPGPVPATRVHILSTRAMTCEEMTTVPRVGDILDQAVPQIDAGDRFDLFEWLIRDEDARRVNHGRGQTDLPGHT